MNAYSNICPICNGELKSVGPEFTLEELLLLWSPVSFSKQTFDEHNYQSSFTQLYECNCCKLGIYLPQIIGKSSFFVDLLNHNEIYFYSKEKWDFDEALEDTHQSKSMIEIGCGPGNFLDKIKSSAIDIYGIEYNDHALKKARNKGYKIFGATDTISDEQKGKFDIAFSFHVLEHVADPTEFVNYLFSWVKPDGKVGISVPNMDGPVKYINPCVSNMPPHHATLWKLATFKKMAEKLNLRIERVAYEPLSEKDQNYYTMYYPNYLITGNSFIAHFSRRLLSTLLSRLIKALLFLGKGQTRMFRGQSIYVLLSRPKV